MFSRLFQKAGGYRSKTVIQSSFILGAVLVGLGGVGFDKAIHWAQVLYNRGISEYPFLTLITSPLLFLLSAALVVKIAPEAKGSGIPQALKAMMMSLGSHSTALKSKLIDIKTAVVKVLSSVAGILAGASIGREGPTVQISTAIFAFVGARVKKVYPHVDFHSYIVAGSAAGVAAAFNTPLAGISFAIEEMAEGSFSKIKQTVMISVIIAGISAQTLVGNYTYFGSPEIASPDINIVVPAILIGLIGGLLGGLFAKILTQPVFQLKNLQRVKWWQRALICGGLVALINLSTGGMSSGSGYEITKSFMDDAATLPWYFPISKFITSLLSYLSGIAGGIFSPSLAIGAGFGVSIGELISFTQLKACALLGMVAYFTGVVQAPLTAVIIVMEMTDLHELIIPLMISAFIAQGISKIVMPTSLYHHLAFHYRPRL